MKLSVVIPTYQRREILARTLPTVFAQDFSPFQYEIIVVVDGSTDGTAEFLRGIDQPACRFKVVEQPNRGLASARNAGLRAATGEVVLFLDDDVLCDASLLRRHVEAHQQPGNWVVSGTILSAPGSHDLAGDLNAAFCEYLSSVAQAGGEARWPQVACGVNDSAPRMALLAAGGFDERFASMREEVELGLRLWKAGVRVRFEPRAVVYHLYDKSARDLVARDAVRFGRNELLLCRLHGDYRPHSPLAELFRSRWTRRLPRQVAARLPVSPGPLLGIPCFVAERLRRIPAARKIGVRLLRARITIELLRSAVREAGSWRSLRQEFDHRLST